ncbi:MAG: hypothetical protein CVU69_08140 [Deltaproteobacteria bacterium HGW-Deltaproteobacteria-4]|nr:MAG: hypothetical protein CVU69_08140 [Deltaproteobacteria bacterium HGW-Deltaproteobacteria-4]
MLFEFPKGFRKDQILSLFRSIIIHDLVKIYGCKTWDISRSIVDKNMSELVDNRGKTLWELFSGRCFENEPILRLLDNEHIETEDCPLETIKSLFFQKLFTNITDTSKSTRKDALGTDKHEHLRKIDQEVLRYLRRAKLMTELASAGKFSSFPSHLK